MFRRIRGRLTYANVMSSLAMFIVLGGVAYASVPNNSVTSKKIVNNAVRSGDLRNNDIRSSDIRTGNVTTSDIANNTVRGDDVDEATLSTIQNSINAVNAQTANHALTADNSGALQGAGLDTIPFGRADNLGGCDPNSTTFVTCASVTLPMPRAGRVFGVGDVQWHSDSGAPTEGQCEMRVDGAGIGEDMFMGDENADDNTSAQQERGAGHSFVTGVLPAGNHTFAVVCREDDGNIDYDEASISAILLGTG